MYNVVKKEFFNQLIKEGKLKFRKNFKETIKNSEYEKLFQNPETLLFQLKSNFGNFLVERYHILKTYNYPDEVLFLIGKILEYNPISNTFIVGGAIRDIILDIKPKDYDIVTDVPYDELLNIFSKFKIKEVGKHFRVIMVKINNMTFEIANFRKDIYTTKNGKGAEKVEIGSLDDDKKRRDFDVNCLYFNPHTNYLIDGNGTGLKSLFKKQFQFVGNPDDRINEDVLRLLRISKLIKKGLNPSKETLKAFRRNFHKLCELGNPSRIREHIEDLMFS